jgi:saccharopine dehydrogenase-like NADP-dependent oxidoreductase
MKKITVLGAGMVGSAIAADLCMDYQVTSADININHLKRLSDSYPVRTLQADLRDPSKIKEVIMGTAPVIGLARPSRCSNWPAPPAWPA